MTFNNTTYFLATDLDGTFLESKNKQNDPLYLYLHKHPEIVVIFNTGRNIELILPLLDDLCIPNPHYIISDVGASIQILESSQHFTRLTPVQPVQDSISIRWRETIESIAHLRDELDDRMERQDQPQERRMSYYVKDESDLPSDLIQKLSQCECDVLHSNTIYVDILPKGVNKGSTLNQLIQHLNIKKDQVIVAGDTMNDFSMYEHGFKGVVLNNAEPAVKIAAANLDNVYFSSKNGTDGILEAMNYFGMIKNQDSPTQTEFPQGNSDLVMLYHRLPYQESSKNGQIIRKQHSSPNGIIPTLLGFFSDKQKGAWVAWSKSESRNPEHFEKHVIVDAQKYENLKVCCVPLTPYDVETFYEVFSKEAFWLLLHSFHEKAVFNHDRWQHFCEINKIFAENAATEAAENAIVWIHDYNLWMVPVYLRQLRHDVKIAFYHHTPFPAADIFNMIPWRRDILNSLLQCDYIGFHIPQYADNFANTIRSNYKTEVLHNTEAAPYFKTYGCAIGADHFANKLRTELNTVEIGVHPAGINCDYINELVKSPKIKHLHQEIKKELGNRQCIVSIERTDYTKGPVEKLKAFEKFLSTYSQFQEKLVFIMVCTPPAKGMKIYDEIAEKIAYHVGLINGKYGTFNWTPIRFVNRPVPFEDVVAFNAAADIGWVTPLRDGLNLVAKEYAYIKHATNTHGALVLSEFAGAAAELHGAFLTNPYDIRDMVETLYTALTSQNSEKKSRIDQLANIIKSYDVNAWGQDFLESVSRCETEHLQP